MTDRTRAPAAVLSRIVHDLRGPLMPLRTAAWLLRNELGTSGRAGDLAEIVDRQSALLARLMDEFGDWGRCAEGRVALDRTPMEVGLAIDLAIGAVECDVRVHHHGDAAAATVDVDQHHLGQALRTLVEHAAQRAPGTPVEVDVAVEGGQLHVVVRDRGPALEPAAVEQLLVSPQPDPFDQGLGLRLLNARMILEAHGGTLTAQGGAEGGLALRLALPARA